MANYKITEFPDSRIATIDVCAAGKQKHHMAALLELDVTESRLKIKALKSGGGRISFTAWLLKEISHSIKANEEAAAFLTGRKRLIIFDDINISILIEKTLNGRKVPMPLVIEKVNLKSISEITEEIETAKKETLPEKTVVINRKAKVSERIYYHLPGYFRRIIWKYILKHPRLAYEKMGNVSFTFVGMAGQIKGWFIHSSIHPVSFGVGSVIKKPLVINDEIKIREVLNLTVLIDHDVIDGVPMVKFINTLAYFIEKGHSL